MRSSPRPRRLTQEQRSAETRARLLNATIQSLVDAGYARTTTTRVCEIAGLSRGAQIHHFRTRTELVTAALEHLARRRVEEFQKRFDEMRAKITDGHDLHEAWFELLWEVSSGDLFIAALEIWVAARTDPQLREQILPLEQEIGRMALAPEYTVGAERRDDRRARDLTDLAYHLARGITLVRILSPDDSRRRRQVELFKQLVVSSLDRAEPE